VLQHLSALKEQASIMNSTKPEIIVSALRKLTNDFNACIWEAANMIEQTAKMVCTPKESMDALDAEIARLVLKNRALKEALQKLYDIQNGPPLIKEKAAWEDAMKKAEELLKDV